MACVPGANLTWDIDTDPELPGGQGSLPDTVCSVWRWCPCDPCDMSYCSRDSSYCPMDDIITGLCTDEPAGWQHVCGDIDLGPPCITGDFYGEAVMICECPSTALTVEAQSSSLIPGDCVIKYPKQCDDLPSGVFPFNLCRLDYIARDYVPQVMIDDELGLGAKTLWTWCPCDNGEADYGADSIGTCGEDLVCTGIVNGPGEWVWRGGPLSLGPPPLVGRFYGETITIGYCCQEISSYVSLGPVDITPGYHEICESLPAAPVYDWEIRATVSVDEEPVGGIVTCGPCSSWVWCPCENDEGSCGVIYLDPAGDCPPEYDPPAAPPALSVSYGSWKLFEGSSHHGAPPSVGRFFGEVVFYCTCSTDCSSSSLSSLSSSLSSESLLSSVPCDDAAPYCIYNAGTGTFKLTGEYHCISHLHGQPYYTNGYWILWFWNCVTEPAEFPCEEWWLTTEVGNGLFGYVLENQGVDNPYGTYTPVGGALGNPVLEECISSSFSEFDADASCTRCIEGTWHKPYCKVTFAGSVWCNSFYVQPFPACGVGDRCEELIDFSPYYGTFRTTGGVPSCVIYDVLIEDLASVPCNVTNFIVFLQGDGIGGQRWAISDGGLSLDHLPFKSIAIPTDCGQTIYNEIAYFYNTNENAYFDLKVTIEFLDELPMAAPMPASALWAAAEQLYEAPIATPLGFLQPTQSQLLDMQENLDGSFSVADFAEPAFWAAMRAWLIAGMPLRSDIEIAEITENTCLHCQHRTRLGTCGEGSCRIQGNEEELRIYLDVFDASFPLRNKARIATEHCPIWLW